MSSPNLNTYSLLLVSLLLSASRICGSMSDVVFVAVGLSGSPLGASEINGGDIECELSMEGEGDSEVAMKVGTPRLAVLELANGRAVEVAAIIENAGVGEGEEMEADVDESVGTSRTGCSVKNRRNSRVCAASTI